MELFGITQFGCMDPIKDMMRDDYVEPKEQEDLLELERKGKLRKPFYEIISELDCYVGRVDGYAYRSNDRLMRMRKKGTFKPVGPLDMYNYPGCRSMEYGWWKDDPALQGQNWWACDYRYGRPMSEKSKYAIFNSEIIELILERYTEEIKLSF